MARTISARRPVGPAGYGATAQGIMDEMARRNPGAFLGDRRAQEAMALRVLQGIGEQELARDVAHQGRAAQAIMAANQQETRRAIDRERLEDMKAAADDWRPKVARVAGAVAPALALGAMAYEQYNTPEAVAQRAMESATEDAMSATPDNSMPMPQDMNPEDLAALRRMQEGVGLELSDEQKRHLHHLEMMRRNSWVDKIRPQPAPPPIPGSGGFA